MVSYLVNRLVGACTVLVVASLVAFGLQVLAPGDPARLLLQASGMEPVSEEAVIAKRAEMRLDEPVPLRYLDWLHHAVQGDFGHSFRSYEPVTRLYLDRLPATAILAIVAVLLSLVIAVPLGVLVAYRRSGLLDALAQVLVVAGSAAPSFWIGLICILVFAATLQWLPAFGTLTPKGIVMPALVLALPYIALLTRLTRAAMLDVLSQEFLTVARAKGLPTLAIARRHALPNALVPVVTVLGLELGRLLSGAVVVEYVFAWPGIGKLAVDAVLIGDIPIVTGFAVAASLVFVLSNLVVDLGLMALDPRVRRD
jgi:peptide/nickel transport system permease protein